MPFTTKFEVSDEPVRAQLTGLAKEELKATSQAIADEIVNLLERQGSAFVGDRIVPSRPGRPPRFRSRELIKSIRSIGVNQYRWDVEAINYASFLEEGTEIMAPRPFIVRSIEVVLKRLNRRRSSRGR